MIPPSKSLFLLGFMGTGKSALGRRLARLARVPFLDTDAEIVRREGRPIPEIFATDGEAAFRSLESALVGELTAPSAPVRVVSCGGGLALDGNNVDRMGAAGVAVCLTASPEVLAERLSRTPGTRPLLALAPGQTLAGRIAELLEARAGAYARIPLHFDTSALPLGVLAPMMQRIWFERCRPGRRGAENGAGKTGMPGKAGISGSRESGEGR